jgi:uncharacterized membrane protein HdeD (DUF308 family)
VTPGQQAVHCEGDAVTMFWVTFRDNWWQFYRGIILFLFGFGFIASYFQVQEAYLLTLGFFMIAVGILVVAIR